MLFRQSGLSSGYLSLWCCHLAILHQGVVFLTMVLSHRVVSDQGGLSPGWSLIRVVSYLGGLLSGWWRSLVWVTLPSGVSDHVGLSPRWSLIRVVSHRVVSWGWFHQVVPHQGSLLSEWSHEGGFIRWSHIRVASYRSGLMRMVSSGGPTSGWPLIGVVSWGWFHQVVPHQGGLLSEWSHEGGFIRWSHIRVASYRSGLMRVVSADGLSFNWRTRQKWYATFAHRAKQPTNIHLLCIRI